MAGFDFSENAIKVAWQRMNSLAVRPRLEAADFVVHDATLPWPWLDNSFDFAIDCFASTDIESEAGRTFARDECRRVLKPGGYLLVYTLSDDDQFHKKTIKQSPGPEKNSLLHPNGGKFEKVFDEDEIKSYYDGWRWREQ